MTGYFVHGAPAGEINKIDNARTDGLLGVNNSLAYRVNEIERHLHSYESWFGLAASPSGEIHRADRIGPGIAPFVIDAGNNDWGTWVQILGSSDTPARTGGVKFDFHKLLFTATENNSVYFFQLGFGESGDDALAAGEFTEDVFVPSAFFIDSGPVEIQNRRKSAGTKIWARCLSDGDNTGTMSFYFGLHEYEG